MPRKKRRVKTVKQKLHDLAWKKFSIYIRTRGMDWRGFNQCVTCGVRKHWKELQAGHRYHGRLDFDEININPQCSRCNHFLSGNLGFYERYIQKTHSKEVADELLLRANTHPGYTVEELKEIILKYNGKPGTSNQ